MLTIDCQDYKIHIGDVAEALSDYLKSNNYNKIAIIVDENTRKHCLQKLSSVEGSSDWTVIEIPSGEENKTLLSCELIWKRLLIAGFDRHCLVINLGGGVIGDMGGFCAASFMRGIDFIQVPTTLLSQVDASVGGKLGIDLDYVKNIIGLFQNPNAVIVDKQFLSTISIEQLRSGFAEVVKHGLIADVKLWNDCVALQKDGLHFSAFDDNFLHRSINVKKVVVEQDPREGGLRKILNFGHTIGHAVETHSWSTDKPLLHGEAIFVGMICENYLSFRQSKISREELDEVNSTLKSIFWRSNACSNGSEIWKILLKDKKNKRNKAFAALINQIGSAVYDIEITREEVMESFLYYQKM